MHPRLAPPLAAAWPLLAILAFLGGCAGSAPPPGPVDPRKINTLTWEQPPGGEGYCAWFGTHRDGVLYFGQAAFWSAMAAAGGDPRGDLQTPGPQRIGRLDLANREAPEPLDVTEPGARSGVWDVLAHPNGQVYYTTFYESAGRVDPATGEVVHFDSLGPGLNELALGSDDQVLATRYGGADGGDGSVVVLDPEGAIVAELRLEPAPEHVVAAKSVAWDPVREEIWVNTDLIPTADAAVSHDARILDREGRELLRLVDPEIQFMAFRSDGTGLSAEVDAEGLWLRLMRPGDVTAMPDRGARVLLDPDFQRRVDFVQDIQFESEGQRAVVMRWSGEYHLVHLAAEWGVSESLPRPSGGLYYTGVVQGDTLCATRCGGIDVVCAQAPVQ